MAEWLEQTRLIDMKCTVMIKRSWVQTPVGSTLWGEVHQILFKSY